MIDLDLLELIYDAALGDLCWDDVMGRLMTGFAAQGSLLIAYGGRPGATSILCRSGQDESAARAYVDHFAAIDPYVAAMKNGALPPGRIMFGDDVVPGKVLCRSEYYNDWFRPHGLRYTAGGQVRNREGLHVLLGLPRSAAAGPYTPEEVRELQIYFNHLRRALDIRDALGARAPVPDVDRIAVCYGLTPAEVRLVAQLLETGPLKHCAARLGCSYHTLRAHLRSVFEKTGTHSQAQLMRLIHQAPRELVHLDVASPAG